MRSYLGLWCVLSIVSLAACSGGDENATPAESNSPATASQPTAPVALSGRILFTRTGEFDVATIFMAEADGTGERQLTDPGYACCPRLSPDGSRVLVMTDEQHQGQPLTGVTFVLGRTDFERLTLRDPTLNLVPQAWSPDGMRIAFEGWDDADPSRTGVYTARFPDGGDLVRLTSTVGGGHDIPSDWSPDGTQLVFYRAKPEPDWDIGGSLWLVNADGTNGRRIETPGVAPSWWARWSPDGTKILFASGRTQPDGAIWTVDADGTRLTRIFQGAEVRFPINPSWSPDGRLIMFSLDPTSDQFQHPANGIYVINADGTGLTLVIGGSDFKSQIEWSR